MRSLFLMALAVPLAAGCHLGPRMNAHLELMNAEKRALEDELYELEFEFEDALRELEGLRKENDRLRHGGNSGTRSYGGDRNSDRSSSGPELRAPMIDDGTLAEPKVELPEDHPPSQRDLPAPKPPLSSPPPSINPPSPKTPPKINVPKSAKSATWSLDPADPRVTHIHLDPLLTGGSNFDQQPGDDGITVVIEPRNAGNEFVPLAGPISVVLLDPAKEGDSSRVARWDLDAEQTGQTLENSSTGRGIRLRLPWPKAPPIGGRLQMFVRYVTVDGRKLEANREIFVTLPGQFSQRWTPRSTSRSAAEKEVVLSSRVESSEQSSASKLSPPSTPDEATMIPVISPVSEKRSGADHEPERASDADKLNATGSEPAKSQPAKSQPAKSQAAQSQPTQSQPASTSSPEWRPHR